MAAFGLLDQVTSLGAALPVWAASAGEVGLALVGGLAGAATAAKLIGGEGGPEGATAPGAEVFALVDGRLRPQGRLGRRGPVAAAPDFAAFAAPLRVLEGPRDLAAALTALEATGIGFRALVQEEGRPETALEADIVRGRPLLSVRRATAAELEAMRLRAELAEAERGRRAAEALLDAAPALLWRRGGDGGVVWANARYREIVGAAGNDSPPELRLDGSAEPLGPSPSRRAVYRAEDGRRLWHDLSERPAPEALALGPRAALGYGSDAAAAVHAEGALRRFVETLTETFAHLRVGLAVFDKGQRLGLFNPAFAELMRLEPSWLAGRPGFNDVLARLRDSGMLPERDDFAVWRKEMGELFGDGPAREKGDRVETWELPGEVVIRVVARPHPQGSVALLFEDVTETARLERRWSIESDTRRAVMDRLVEGVAAFGPAGEARFANPAFARIWGFRPGRDGERLRFREALARFRAASDPSAAWDRLAAFFEHPETRSPWSEEVRLKDGARLRARVAALPDGSVLTAFEDVTDRHLVEGALRDRNDALEAAEEIRGALIEQISSRLSTPLTTIGGLARMLREEGAAGAAGRRLAAISDATEEIRDALAGVVDLASAQSGAMSLDTETVDLGEALTAAIEQARSAAERRGVLLAAAPRSADAEDLAAAADAARVRQILFNLLADAVHRAPAGGLVRAGARRRDGRVEVWTEEPATAADVGGPGFAEDAGVVAPWPGAPRRRGLAHALVRRFAELHGGEVRVEAAGVAEDAPPAPEPPLPFERQALGAPRQRVICALPVASPAPPPPVRLRGLPAVG